MAAADTFEWFVAMVSRDAGPETQKFVAEQRSHLQALRSEDERQRFVEDLMHTFRRMAGGRKK